MIPLALFLLLEIALAVLDHLNFHMNLEIFFLSFHEVSWAFHGMALNFLIDLGG